MAVMVSQQLNSSNFYDLKILIANSGEIAHRIMKACRELDITSTTIYSKVDKVALHVRRADKTYLMVAKNSIILTFK